MKEQWRIGFTREPGTKTFEFFIGINYFYLTAAVIILSILYKILVA
jgi:hypothetical protein